MRPRRFILPLALLLLVTGARAAETPFDRARQAVDQKRFTEAAGLLRGWLEDHPADPDARFLYARILSWRGQRAAALAQFDRLLATDPDNVDYLLGKAQTLLWDSRPREALPLIVKARARAPRYLLLWRLNIEALRAVGDAEHDAMADDLLREARRRFPDTPWDDAALAGVHDRPAAPGAAPLSPSLTSSGSHPHTWEAELGTSYEGLDRGADWRSLYLEGSWNLGPRNVLYGQVRTTERYNLRDRELTAGAYLPITPDWTGLLEGTLSPDFHVLPHWSLLGQVQRTLEDGWGLHAGLRHSEYRATYADLLLLTLERYWDNYHAAYTLYGGKAEGAGIGSSHRLQFNRFYADDSRVGIACSWGRETENDQGTLLTADVLSVSVNGRHWFRPAWAVSYELLYYDQGDSYIRRGLRIGFRHRY